MPTSSPVIPIYTIGYGARSLEQFLATLQHYQIAYLIDVRSAPYSKFKPEFAKTPLEQALKAAGIRYVYMGDTLGGRPDDPACYTDGKVDYAKVQQTERYQQGIGRLHRAFAQQQRVALMCAEGKPEECHRAQLIGVTLTEQAIPVLHIDEHEQPQSQRAVLARTSNGQLALASLTTPDDSTPTQDSSPPAQQMLKRIFGFAEFRPSQQPIIDHVLARRDTLVIMPTGSGKSLCYQLPALLFDGLTVVVSPLIALMQDQVDQLRALGVAARFLNSSLHYTDYTAVMRQVRQGAIKLLYVAPETLLRPETLVLLEQSHVTLIAVDEAHCVSEWGHDFRPEYRQLAGLRERFRRATWIALTATATPRVQGDIKAALGLCEENTFVSSFDRPNLFLRVAQRTKLLPQVTAFLEEHRGQSGIIYCTTRRGVMELHAALNTLGFVTLPYHAELDDATRRRNQTAFLRDDVPIMVATIAFGMGINKPDVRFVLHTDLPKNMESYYQQIGRAGRDGLRADCLLLFTYGDVHTIQRFIDEGAESQGRERSLLLQALVRWAEGDECRRRQLLAYFGEHYAADSCGMCDNCLAEPAEKVDLTLLAQKFLSCVARTGEQFGVNYVIQVLRGSQAQEILRRRHDQLSTYGIGREQSMEEWKQAARQFIQQELVEQDLTIGNLRLTAKGRAIFTGAQVWGRPLTPPAAPTTRSVGAEEAAYDPALFEQLRTLRKTLADAQGVPPYVIFADRTLHELATYFPHSRAAFAMLHGVGERKLQQYADAFLDMITAYCVTHGLQEQPKPAASPALSSSVRSATATPRNLLVTEAFRAGKTIAELMTEYGVKRQTIINHLDTAVHAGQALPVERLRGESTLDETEQTRVLALFQELSPEWLRPIFEALHEQVPYDELQLLRLIYRLQTS
jgi:ATP-dependent DNA helicase RecQ